MAYIQVKAFAQTKATVWREFGKNGHLSPELVLLQGGSIGKHFHDCDLNIGSLGADPFLNHHQTGCADQRPCEHEEHGKDLGQKVTLSITKQLKLLHMQNTGNHSIALRHLQYTTQWRNLINVTSVGRCLTGGIP